MGRLAAGWGVVGVVVLLSVAIYRLALVTLESLHFEYQWYHWSLLGINVVFMCYAEGYRGFQRSFSPRFAARARHIRNHPNLVRIVLAPLFCMGYFETTRRRLVSVYLLTIGIVVLVIMFHQLSQPWRGVLDAGVVFGLAWGVISLLWCSFTALGKADYPYSPELPV